jgi:hypothetical protein
MPWHQFHVGSPDTSQYDCQPLTKVYHTAHLESAHRIIIDGKIRSGLVFDESKLKTERILVAWLSPNEWIQGSRYGSISFVFDWPTLSEGHRAYWIESIHHRPKGSRILLTMNDHSNKPDLFIPYDPKAGGGPWWFDVASGTHYWNAEHYLEFMVEHDIDMSDLKGLEYVEHHKRQCKISPRNCPERGLQPWDAAGRFLARLAASKATFPPSILDRGGNSWEGYAKVAFGRIESIAKVQAHGVIGGDLTPENPGSAAIARALLNAYANPKLRDEIPYLVGLFRNRKALRESCRSLIRAVVRSK